MIMRAIEWILLKALIHAQDFSIIVLVIKIANDDKYTCQSSDYCDDTLCQPEAGELNFLNVHNSMRLDIWLWIPQYIPLYDDKIHALSEYGEDKTHLSLRELKR